MLLQEVREHKRALGQVETEAAAKAAAFTELQQQLESQREQLEKEQRLKGHMETRLGMLAREMKDMRTFMNDPNKRHAVPARKASLLASQLSVICLQSSVCLPLSSQSSDTANSHAEAGTVCSSALMCWKRGSTKPCRQKPRQMLPCPLRIIRRVCNDSVVFSVETLNL